MERNIDNQMSRLCNRLMSVAQSALDSQQYIIEEMEFIAEQNPEREDVKACIAEVKAKNKASESENWTTANHWGEHFDGISTEEEPADKPADSGSTKTEETADDD